MKVGVLAFRDSRGMTTAGHQLYCGFRLPGRASRRHKWGMKKAAWYRIELSSEEVVLGAVRSILGQMEYLGCQRLKTGMVVALIEIREGQGAVSVSSRSSSVGRGSG